MSGAEIYSDVTPDQHSCEGINLINNSEISKPARRSSVHFSPELFQDICRELLAGHSLREICSWQGMPTRQAFLEWCRDDPDLARQYATARELALHLIEDEIVEMSRSLKNDPGSIRAAQTRFAMLRWIIGKRAARVHRVLA